MCNSKEFKKTLKKKDKELVSKFRLLIGYNLEENYIIPKKYDLLAIIPERKEEVPIFRTEEDNTKRTKRHLLKVYERRSIVETIHSITKRKSNLFIGSRIKELVEKEIVLKTIAYNIRRVIILKLFYVYFSYF